MKEKETLTKKKEITAKNTQYQERRRVFHKERKAMRLFCEVGYADFDLFLFRPPRRSSQLIQAGR
jgi:hypothetical protein